MVLQSAYLIKILSFNFFALSVNYINSRFRSDGNNIRIIFIKLDLFLNYENLLKYILGPIVMEIFHHVFLMKGPHITLRVINVN